MCGYPIEKAVKEPNTYVVEFPVKAPNADNPNFRSSGEVSLEEQFANQYLFAYNWADNSVSATLTFKPEEQDKIEPLLRAYSNRLKSTSMLPYSGHGYVQAPWEPITKDEYERRVSQLVMTIEEAYDYIPLTDVGQEVYEADCSKGGCPVK
jgi:ribonucleoside-triphosphate reductase